MLFIWAHVAHFYLLQKRWMEYIKTSAPVGQITFETKRTLHHLMQQMKAESLDQAQRWFIEWYIYILTSVSLILSDTSGHCLIEATQMGRNWNMLFS